VKLRARPTSVQLDQRYVQACQFNSVFGDAVVGAADPQPAAETESVPSAVEDAMRQEMTLTARQSMPGKAADDLGLAFSAELRRAETS